MRSFQVGDTRVVLRQDTGKMRGWIASVYYPGCTPIRTKILPSDAGWRGALQALRERIAERVSARILRGDRNAN
jgi:hypothetical protein